MNNEQKSNFMSNGSLLQEELISFCNWKNLPIRVFSGKELMKMSDFSQNQLFEEGSTFEWYKGVMENRSISIKTFHSLFQYVGMKGIIREIVVATQMGVHCNAFRLLGCCLETEFPALVSGYPDHGCLTHQISKQTCNIWVSSNEYLPWKIRLRIGYEISYALAYFHNGFNRPIVYRNLSARDVFLDNDNRAKLTGFYMPVIIPESEVHVMDAVVGTTGWSAPEYCLSGRLTEKTDVYMFGNLLLNLLADQRLCKRGQPLFVIDEVRDYHRYGQTTVILDPKILKEGEENGLQLQQQ